MPIYTFRNKTTGEEWEDLMSISEMETFTKKRNIELVPTSVGIVSSVGQLDSKIDGGMKEVFSKIGTPIQCFTLTSKE